MKTNLFAAALIVLCMAAVAPAEILTDGNSTASFDLSSAGLGMDGWTVNGVNQLYEQSFWCQVDSGSVQRINALTLSSSSATTNELKATYTGSGFKIDVDWTLYGADPGYDQSNVAEVIRITDTSRTASLNFHFWQFVDLNLLDTPFDTAVSISGGNTAVQSDGDLAVSETADVPVPSRYEAGFRQDVLADLQSGLLNNNGSQVNGDLAWAFQWDRSIGPGSSLIISKDKQLDVMPEPSTFILLGIGVIGLLGYAWRRRA